MPSDDLPFVFKNVVFCDDVRPEITGQDVIIGAYGGGLIVRQLPTLFQFCVWITMSAKTVGRHLLEIDILGPSNVRIGGMSTNITVANEDNNASFTVGRITTELQQEGNISICVRTESGERIEIASLPVALAKSNPITESASVSSQPVSQSSSAGKEKV